MSRAFPIASATLLALCAAAPAMAGQIDSTGGTVRLVQAMNDTGLTRCTRDFSTFTSDCAGTGQDAETGRDAAHPAGGNGHGGFTFVKVCNSGETAGSGSCSAAAVLGSGPDDWGCTLDRVTGLEWEVKAADGGLRDVATRYTNFGDGRAGDASAFVAAVNAAGLCGTSDWRLPSSHELQGIENFNRAKPHPSIDSAWFPNTLVDHYWASEPFFGQESTVAWITSFIMDPRNISTTAEARTTLNGVRLVRSTAAAGAAAARRFVVQDDEALDANSRLVWMRCSAGQSWDGTTCSGHVRKFDFGGAIAFAQQKAADTGKAWRVPNAKELYSLVDNARPSPAIDTDVFPGTPASLYWTSTAYAWTATGGWVVTFDGGHTLAYYSGYELALRLVRDGN